MNVVLFHAASRAIGKLMPAGSQTSLLGPRLNEDGEPDDVCVWVRPPAPKRQPKLRGRDTILDMLFEPIKPVRGGDDSEDWRLVTLKWVPDTLEVYAIKEVAYTKDRHPVTRSIEPRRRKRRKF